MLVCERTWFERKIICPNETTIDIQEFDIERDWDKALLLLSAGGLGKSYTICLIEKMLKELKKKYVIIAFTNASVIRLKNDGVEAWTIDSFFGFESEKSTYKSASGRTHDYWWTLDGFVLALD